ncbi:MULTISPECIES: hypothetical protein [unclassified Granulicatella]|uniref:hypothetical protein n=1 Tax=unclassified Granulicatella TaxID=2630493 RepID=UPI002557029D|nr:MULTISPECIES: hypothetical protein [unclassified Granulicatella]MDK8380117.1 hypothetical protein [Granulicatella sp. UMB5615B]MDK8522861.1 hypothetical protein [Granulicatella sp. UMB5615A]
MMKSLSKVYQYMSFICLLIQFLFSIYFYNQSGVFFEEGVLILFQSLTGLLVIGIVQRSNRQHDWLIGVGEALILLLLCYQINASNIMIVDGFVESTIPLFLKGTFGICSQLVLLMMGWSILQLLMQLGRMFCVKRVTT